MGCPKATAPPKTFVRSCAIPSYLCNASTVVANASLNSKKSISFNYRWAFSKAFCEDSTGEIQKSTG